MRKANKLFLIALVVEIVFLVGWWLKVEWDIRKMGRQVQKMRAEIQQVEKENHRLTVILEEKINDPFYIEKQAREKLGLAEKGDIVYRIVPAEE